MRAARAAPRAAVATPQRVIRLTRCVLAALGLTALVAAPASASTPAPSPAPGAATAGGIGLRLIDAPVPARNDPRARVYIVDHLAPGRVIHRRIEVSNTDGRVTATVTIAVPRDAPPGEQYGVVWAEARSAPIVGGGVIQVSRVGIRLYLSVGPGGPPAANFTIDSLTAKRSPDGRPVVLANVRNTGGRALDVNGTLQLLAGPGGLSAGPFPATLGATLAIGDGGPVTIALDRRLPAGPWDARITLRSGLLERRARATITFPDTGASPLVIATTPRPGWLYPAVAGLVVLLLGTAALLVVQRWRW